MTDHRITDASPRREFLGKLAAGTAAAAAASLVAVEPLLAQGKKEMVPKPPIDDSWMGRIKGRHRQVFDAQEINSGFPLVFAYVYKTSNMQGYGLSADDISAVVVMRHRAATLGFNDDVWSKYKLGEMFNITDPVTKAPAVRNLYNNMKGGELPLPDAAYDKQVPSGLLVVVCNVALGVLSSMAGEKIGVSPADARADWEKGLLPGAHLAVSGVAAVGRAQEHGCHYCAAS